MLRTEKNFGELSSSPVVKIPLASTARSKGSVSGLGMHMSSLQLK